MKAIVLTHYGPPGVLQLQEINKPEPTHGEVLVKVCATAVNDWDWCFVRGKPYIYRLMFGLTKPKVRVLGAEVSGTVEAVGNGVRRFKLGDDVYGDVSEAGFGAFAEYVCVREDALALMPPGMPFEQAAAIPHAAMLALQGLVDVGRIQKGERILINGAGGGVGTFGVQIAKQYGAEVTGVDRESKLDTLRAVGFDHVIDYRQQDFTRNGQRYDLILDAKFSAFIEPRRSVRDCRRSRASHAPDLLHGAVDIQSHWEAASNRGSEAQPWLGLYERPFREQRARMCDRWAVSAERRRTCCPALWECRPCWQDRDLGFAWESARYTT